MITKNCLLLRPQKKMWNKLQYRLEIEPQLLRACGSVAEPHDVWEEIMRGIAYTERLWTQSYWDSSNASHIQAENFKKNNS